MENKIKEFDRIVRDMPGFIKEVGMQFLEVSEGYCKGRIYISEKHLNPMGTVHGGVIFSLADTIGGRAAMTYGTPTVTLTSSINYLSPGKDTEYIEAEANVVRNGRTTSVVDVMIRSAEGVDIAKVTITFYKVVYEKS